MSMHEEAQKLAVIAEKVGRSRQLVTVSLYEISTFHMPKLEEVLGDSIALNTLKVMHGDISQTADAMAQKIDQMRAYILQVAEATRRAGE